MEATIYGGFTTLALYTIYSIIVRTYKKSLNVPIETIGEDNLGCIIKFFIKKKENTEWNLWINGLTSFVMQSSVFSLIQI